ncbi:hypothetical protein DdX_00259 [Ditylenchus destructor]|uniref:Uncharacterized protein n=1 Tax=Ditylenchus destructor TaxID=166010 RepID=A0AAD4R736_9BILA|nr:hypothetical protein DdX_00259 [Ditylenchus destructor]
MNKISMQLPTLSIVFVSSRCASLTLRPMTRYGFRRNVLSINNFRCFSSEAQPRSTKEIKPSALGSNVPLPRQWRERTIYFFKSIVMPVLDGQFTSANTLSRHIQDNVPVKNWCLIYDDRSGAAFHSIFAALIFLAIGTALYNTWDLYTDGDKWSQLADSAVTAGTLAVFVGLAFTFALTCVAIYQRRNLFRIYQNRTSPEQLLVRAAKGTVRRKWMLIKRRDISLINNQAPVDGGQSIFEPLKGNIRVDGQAFILKNEAFRGNNYRSYMLNFSDTVPRDLLTTDKFASHYNNEVVIRKVETMHNDDDMNVAERIAGPKETKLPPGIRFIRAIAIPLILAAIYMEYTIDYQREKAAARLSRVTP